MSENNTHTHLAGDAIKTILAAGATQGDIKQASGLQAFTLVPEGYVLTHVPYALPKPADPLFNHIRQSVVLQDVESFIAYVKLYRTHLTRIFGTPLNLRTFTDSRTPAKFTAIMDYHESGKEQEKAERRKAHRASYPCPLSAELIVWLEVNGKKLTQLQFIEFIESNAPDIVSPTAATLMEMAMNFSQTTNVVFKSTYNRTTGGRQLVYDEQVVEGSTGRKEQKMTVPESMKIKLPVFDGGKAFEITARLEYRTERGALTISYHLQRPQDIFRQAFKEITETIATGTEIQILTGSVE